MSSIKNQSSASEPAIEIKYKTVEEALNAIENKNGWELKYCTPELQANENVVLAALKENSWNFKYTSDILKNNKDFILKALHEGVKPCGIAFHSTKIIQSNIEVMTLAVEKSNDCFEFSYAQGDVAINKELAAKALIKYQKEWGDFYLWDELDPTMKEFFPKDSFYEKAQSYLNQLNQERQAEMTSGGTKEEDGVVW